MIFQSTLPSRGVTNKLLEVNFQNAFQSTLPSRGVTIFGVLFGFRFSGISIHTPLAGSDVYAAAVDRFGEDFNPHSPRGE